MPGFLWTLLLSSFPFADFSGHPFTVICYSHKYDYTLTLEGLSGESPPLGMVLGAPDTHAPRSLLGIMDVFVVLVTVVGSQGFTCVTAHTLIHVTSVVRQLYLLKLVLKIM